MQPDELAYAGVTRQAALIRAGEVSSRELVELYLERIERLDPELNAFRSVLAERALADAGQADARRGAGDERPLLGVPIAVKDSEDVAGEPTAWGTAAHGGPAARDNEFVARLRAAGAVIVGKTNLPELAIMGDTEGPAFGVTRNPWDSDRTPGGSSGGSAAAVAAGLCAAATASDGAGSIRIPASCCGLVGLKPQRDRIPLAPLDEHWYGLSVVGFLTRTVADTALLLDATAPGGDYVAAAAGPPARLRVALSLKPPGLDPCGRGGQGLGAPRGRRAALARARGGRARPGLRAGDGSGERAVPGRDRPRRPRYRPARAPPAPHARLRAPRPRVTGLVGWARRTAAEHAARINELFRDHDVLLTPTLAHTPARAAKWEGVGATRALLEMAQAYPFNGIWNLTGQPALSIPGPPAGDGMPLGAQLVGPPDGEARLLSLGAQLEAELGWPERRPTLE